MNTIIGLVRDKAATKAKILAELGNKPNIKVVQADMSIYESLQVGSLALLLHSHYDT